MKVSVESPSPTERRVAIAIDAEAVEKELAKSYRELSRHTPVRGFRPGKTPRNILERLYGKVVNEEVKEKLIQETVLEAFKQEKIEPVGQPVVEKSELAAGGELQYTILVDVKPEIELRDYLNIEVKPEPVLVTEQEVDDQLEAIRNAHAVAHEVTERRPLRRADIAIIDYHGLDEAGVPLPGFTGEDRQVEVGSAGILKQVDEALEGMTAGETRDVPVEFPADHPNKKISGKRITLRVHVKTVKEKVLPALDDELAKDVGDFENLAALRAATRERLLTAARNRARARQSEELVRMIIERNPFEAPRALIENEVKTLMAGLQMQAGIDPSKWSEEDVARVRSQLSEPARFRVRRSLILEKIAEKEGITVPDADLDAYFEGVAKAAGQNPKAVKAEFEKEERIEALRAELREGRVLDFLLERARIGADEGPSGP